MANLYTIVYLAAVLEYLAVDFLSVHVSKFLLVVSIVSWKMAISMPSVLVLVCQVSWSLNSQVMQPVITKNTCIVPRHLQLAVWYVSILLLYISQT